MIRLTDEESVNLVGMLELVTTLKQLQRKEAFSLWVPACMKTDTTWICLVDYRKVEKATVVDLAPKTKKDLEEDQRRYLEQLLD